MGASAEGGRDGSYLSIAIAIAALAAAGLAWLLLRRRRDSVEEQPVGVEPLPPPAPPVRRARLSLAFRARRAGLNLLSATSENEIVLVNTGDAPAADIRVLAQLTSAHPGQDADLAAFFAAPIGRPEVPAFTLAPGEERAVTSIAALPRDAIRSLDAAGRPMFVPIVAVNVLYASGDGIGQVGQAFAIGVERVDSAKLAPFWLDALPKGFEQVAARPVGPAVER